MPQIRLQRYLSQAGVAARRKAEQLILAGRVRVNGRVVRELGTRVDPGRDVVDVDGVRATAQGNVYLVLNKPKGTVSTVSDPQGRPTVMELLPEGLPAGVRPIGRLDFYTEGVLLFTNDGDLQAGLLSPRSHIAKTYHVKLRGEIGHEDTTRWRRGVRLDDGMTTRPAKVDVLKRTGRHTWLVVTITEGRSRQIHRTAEALGYQVLKLARVAFGGITYFGLRVGECRSLSPAEVADLRRLVFLPAAELAPTHPGSRTPPEGKKPGTRGRAGRESTSVRPRAGASTERRRPGARDRGGRTERRRGSRGDGERRRD